MAFAKADGFYSNIVHLNTCFLSFAIPLSASPPWTRRQLHLPACFAATACFYSVQLSSFTSSAGLSLGI